MRIATILSVLFLISCASPSTKDWNSLKNKEQHFFTEAKEKAIEEDAADGLLKSYTDFLAKHPNFEENPEIMLRQADVYLGLDKWFMALDVFNDFEKLYPDHKKVAFARFSKGLVCEMAFHRSGYYKHKDYSIAFYKEFLEKHPDHKLAESAKGSIQNMK